jgi:hypothetical protein
MNDVIRSCASGGGYGGTERVSTVHIQDGSYADVPSLSARWYAASRSRLSPVNFGRSAAYDRSMQERAGRSTAGSGAPCDQYQSLFDFSWDSFSDGPRRFAISSDADVVSHFYPGILMDGRAVLDLPKRESFEYGPAALAALCGVAFQLKHISRQNETSVDSRIAFGIRTPPHQMVSSLSRSSSSAASNASSSAPASITSKRTRVINRSSPSVFASCGIGWSKMHSSQRS